MLVASFNPGYQRGFKELKPSTRQRFITLSFNYPKPEIETEIIIAETCLLYTSDAADERSSVDLGGRRIIKKKKKKKQVGYSYRARRRKLTDLTEREPDNSKSNEKHTRKR